MRTITIAGFAVAMIILLIIGAVSYRSSVHLATNFSQVTRSHEVLEALASVLAHLTEAETAQRGFIITGNEELLRPFDTAIQSVTAALTIIGAGVEESPRQQDRLAALEPLITARIERITAGIQLRRSDGFASAMRYVAEGSGTEIMNQVRSMVADLEIEERATLAQRSILSDLSVRQTQLVVVLGTIAALLVTSVAILLINRDIRRRVEAEENLILSEERFRDLIENANDIIQSVTPEGNFEYVNAAWRKALGYTVSDVANLSIKDIIHEDSQPHCVDVFRRVLSGEDVGEVHAVLSAKDGSKVYVEGHVSCRFQNGKPLFTRTMFRDVTEKRAAEEARQIAEQRYQTIFENAADGVIQAGVDGRLFTANPAMARMLGFDSPGSLLEYYQAPGRRLYVDNRRRNELIRTLLRRGFVASFECQLYRKDGSAVWTSGSGRAVKDSAGRVLYYERIITEIDEKKRIQDDLERLTVQLQCVLSSATQVSIIATDTTGVIQVFNAGAEKMLGYSAEEMMGKQTPAIIHYEPEVVDRAAELTAYFGRRVEGFDVFVEYARRGHQEVREWTYVRKDGSHLTVNLAVTGVRNTLGDLVGFLGVATDISEQKRAEKERLCLNEELRRKNSQLEQYSRHLEEASRAKSEFLANMSHELRTPLNGIIGFAEVMHDGTVGPVSEEHREYLGDILQSARHLLVLINGILDLAKVEAAKMEFYPEAINLPDLINDLIATVRSIAAKKSIKIVAEFSDEVPEVFLDSSKLKQVVYNYLSNAIKFTSDGGTVIIRTLPYERGRFRLEVQDTGVGIRREDIRRLFIEFQQLDEGASKKYQGTGLGLALTRRIVEAQGGEVGVTSTPGEGSTFFAILPKAMLAAPSAETVSQFARELRRVDLPESARSVLVVDDDPNVRKLMEAALGQIGYRAICVSSAEHGLHAIRQSAPDLVILDIFMPFMNGFEFISELERQGSTPVPVIVWTNKDLTREESDLLSRRVLAIVSKKEGGTSSIIRVLQKHLAMSAGDA